MIVGGVQLEMLQDLAKLYEVHSKKSTPKQVATAATIGVAHLAVTRSLHAKLIKAAASTLPAAGTAMAGLTWPGLLAFATWHVGKACVEHYERGGLPEDFEPTAALHNPITAIGFTREKS